MRALCLNMRAVYTDEHPQLLGWSSYDRFSWTLLDIGELILVLINQARGPYAELLPLELCTDRARGCLYGKIPVPDTRAGSPRRDSHVHCKMLMEEGWKAGPWARNLRLRRKVVFIPVQIGSTLLITSTREISIFHLGLQASRVLKSLTFSSRMNANKGIDW